MPRLDLRIMAARNLPNTESFGKIDPYCIVKFEGKEWRTHTEDNTTNPEWEEVFKFNVADQNSSRLHFVLWDNNVVSDDFLGEYYLSIAGLQRGVVVDKWLLLQNCKANAELRVRLCAVDFGDVEESETPPHPTERPMPPGYQPPPVQEISNVPAYPEKPDGYPHQQQQGYPPHQQQQGYPPHQQQGYPPHQQQQGSSPQTLPAAQPELHGQPVMGAPVPNMMEMFQQFANMNTQFLSGGRPIGGQGGNRRRRDSSSSSSTPSSASDFSSTTSESSLSSDDNYDRHQMAAEMRRQQQAQAREQKRMIQEQQRMLRDQQREMRRQMQEAKRENEQAQREAAREMREAVREQQRAMKEARQAQEAALRAQREEMRRQREAARRGH